MSRVVIKIGSRILKNSEGGLNLEAISSLAKDVCCVMKKKNIQFAIVSSGAVSAGRSRIDLDDLKVESEAISYDKSILKEQVLASIGQPLVMNSWITAFDKVNICCSQILTTRAVFANRKDYLSIRSVATNLLRLGVVPIFNENDVLSPEEIDFTDNDQQACMVAAMLSADKLIILTDVEGVYDGSPNKKESKLIKTIKEPVKFISSVDKFSGTGKGGMKSKLLSADLATSLGIDMYIAGGMNPKAVSGILEGKSIGTFFPAKSKEKLKPLKSWLASAASSEGKIMVSTFLADILRSKKAASVLFSGIENIEGVFSKGSVVEICDEKGASLGRGMARYDSDQLKKEIKKYKNLCNKDKAEIKTSKIIAIHYNYLVFN